MKMIIESRMPLPNYAFFYHKMRALGHPYMEKTGFIAAILCVISFCRFSVGHFAVHSSVNRLDYTEFRSIQDRAPSFTPER
jgi:hypothetical protein